MFICGYGHRAPSGCAELRREQAASNLCRWAAGRLRIQERTGYTMLKQTGDSMQKFNHGDAPRVLSGIDRDGRVLYLSAERNMGRRSG